MRKPRLSKRTIKWLLKGEYVESKDHQFNIETRWNEEQGTYEDVLYRVNIHTGDVDQFTLTAPEGIWKFLKKEIDKDA
jgi:hypothetical protein|nr:MAG TPA: hypothetical protein [Microviridae sp.]